MIGNFGQAEVFSFHATKFINSFEGGAIATNDDNLAARARRITNFGFGELDKTCSVGTNGKMAEVCAAMGLTNLNNLDNLINVNRLNYNTYQKCLEGIPGVYQIRYDESELNNYQYIVLEVDSTLTGLSRDLLLNILRAENVLARRYFYPGCHNLEPYITPSDNSNFVLPETEILVQRIISLPTGTSMNPKSIETICRVIRFCVEHNHEITRRISNTQPSPHFICI